MTAELGATYLLDFTERNLPSASSVSLLDTVSNPNSLRIRGSFKWEFRPMGLVIGLNRTGSYRDTGGGPIRTVSAWTTVDGQLFCALDENIGSVLRNSRIVLNVRNLTDRRPPFAADRLDLTGYDAENTDAVGRVVSIGLSRRF